MTQQIVTRRHLPHWFVTDAYHFVTYRLAGTIPQKVLEELLKRQDVALKQKLPIDQNSSLHRERIHKAYFAEFDRYLDNHCEIRWLREPEIAAIIRENLYFHHRKKYELLSYCVMPNHVHVLLRPIGARIDGVEQAGLPVLRKDGQSPLSEIMHSLKSYTANRANKLLGRKGEFWQDESYDHWVRDGEELERIIEYIAQNPVKAGLAVEPHEWHCCAARDRFLQDGSLEAWLLP